MLNKATVFRITGQMPSSQDISEKAAILNFVPCGASQEKSFGFIPPREENGPMLESIAGQWIMKSCIETKSVPKDVLDRKVQEQVDHLEQTTGRKPGKKEKREIREEALYSLLPTAFPKRKHYNIWISRDGMLVTDATGAALDAVMTLIIKTIDGIAIQHLQTTLPAQTAMSSWILNDEDPAGFTSDRFLELKATDESKAVVRYKNHAIDTLEVVAHVKQGKLPAAMALTHNDRTSFVLTDKFQIKSIAFLDVVFEEKADGVDAFDADWTIATAELSALIQSLIAALGGEVTAKEQA